MLKHLLFGVGPAIFFAASFFVDYKRLSILRVFAVQHDLPPISTNPFRSSSSVIAIRKALPTGPAKRQVRILEIASAFCWFAFAGLLLVPIWNEYLAK
jgi:hypothetical protein